MLWMGLTGCVGCGKTSVGQILQKNFGSQVISADEISHSVLKSDTQVQNEIKKRWSLDYEVSQNFTQYRQEIAKKVFASKEELDFLEKLLHPKIKQKVANLKKNLSTQHKYVFYDVPLLFEKNMQDMFDKIIGVFAPPKIQFERLEKRNQWSKADIENRIKNQMTPEQKISQCDFVIYNDKDFEFLEAEVLKLYKSIEALCA